MMYVDGTLSVYACLVGRVDLNGVTTLIHRFSQWNDPPISARSPRSLYLIILYPDISLSE